MTLHSRNMMTYSMHLPRSLLPRQEQCEVEPFKDTVIGEPHMSELNFDFVVDNPGDWFSHPYNLYYT